MSYDILVATDDAVKASLELVKWARQDYLSAIIEYNPNFSPQRDNLKKIYIEFIKSVNNYNKVISTRDSIYNRESETSVNTPYIFN